MEKLWKTYHIFGQVLLYLSQILTAIVHQRNVWISLSKSIHCNAMRLLTRIPTIVWSCRRFRPQVAQIFRIQIETLAGVAPEVSNKHYTLLVLHTTPRKNITISLDAFFFWNIMLFVLKRKENESMMCISQRCDEQELQTIVMYAYICLFQNNINCAYEKSASTGHEFIFFSFRFFEGGDQLSPICITGNGTVVTTGSSQRRKGRNRKNSYFLFFYLFR